jgi:hypothetical protein
MRTLDDDLGHRLELPRSPTRVVSLVPSLTEALAVSVPDRSGGSDRLVHPSRRSRGHPGARHEEPGPCDAIVGFSRTWWWPTRRRTAGSTSSVCARPDPGVGDGGRVGRRGPVVAAAAAGRRPGSGSTPMAHSGHGRVGAGRPSSWARVVVPIWRDPWMVVGPQTFSGDLIARMGLATSVADASSRYPKREIVRMSWWRRDPTWSFCPTSPIRSGRGRARGLPRRSPARWCRAETSPGTGRQWLPPGSRAHRTDRSRSGALTVGGRRAVLPQPGCQTFRR